MVKKELGHKKKISAGNKKKISAGNKNDSGVKTSKKMKKSKTVSTSKQSSEKYLKKLKKEDPEFYEQVMLATEELGSDDDESDNELQQSEHSDNMADSEEDFGSFTEDDPELTSDLEDEEDNDEEEDNEDEEGEEDNEEEEETEDENEAGDNQEDEEDNQADESIVTLAMLKKWSSDLHQDKQVVKAFKNISQALRAAIKSIEGSEKVEEQCSFKVVGSHIFNEVVRLCLREVAPMLYRVCECKTSADRPRKTKKWSKLKIGMKSYLRDLMLLMRSVSEPSVVEVILKKGVLPIINFYLCFSEVAWSLLKHLVTLWCTSHENVRVLAFIAIFRLTQKFKDEKRDKALKMLYLSYVKNCRFTSPNTWPLIDFMRVSLVELYTIDQALAYRHTFTYVRQMAFHLRNAMMMPKPEKVQLVFNWQYVHCLHLWAELLGKTFPSPILKPLIYPLVQVASGTIQLNKGNRYFPIVFHVCDILTDLSHQTSTFIPVVPFLLHLLAHPKLLSRPKKESEKQFEWPCIIKLSTSQLEESGFTDGMVEQFYSSIYKYLSTESASIGFPELVVPTNIKLKDYLKHCKIVTYKKKIQQLLEKMKENSEYIVQRRRGVGFAISDLKAVKDWEIACRQSEPPLLKFYDKWKNSKEEEVKKGLQMPKIKVKREREHDEEDIFDLKNIRKRQRDGLEQWEDDDIKPLTDV